jgi:hypothetical protein
MTDREYQVAWEYGRAAGREYGEAAFSARDSVDRYDVEDEAHGVAFDEALADSALMDTEAPEVSHAVWDGVHYGLNEAEDLWR